MALASAPSCEDGAFRLAEFARHLDDLLWVTTPDYRQIIYLSPAYEKIFGQTKAEALRDPEAWMRAIHPEDLPEMRRVLAQDLGQGPILHEYRIRRPDGTIRWIASTIYPVKDGQGRLIRAAGIVKDISGLKEAQAQLQASDQRYRAIVESQRDIVCLFRPDTTVLFVNSACCKFLDQRFEDIVGKPFLPALLEAEQPLLLAHFASLRPSRPDAHIEHRLPDRLGRERWVQWVHQGFFDGGGRLTEVLGVGREVTERRRVVEALRAHQEQLQEAQHLAGVGSWVWEVSERRLSWSEELYRLHGLEPDGPLKLDGTFSGVQTLIHPEDRTLWEGLLERILERRQGFPVEYRILRGDGQIRTLSSNQRVQLDDRGAVIRIIGTVQDVSESRQRVQSLMYSQPNLLRAERMARMGRYVFEISSGSLNWSEGVFRIFGEDPARYHPSLESFLTFIHPEDLPRALSAVDFKNGKVGPYQIEFRIVRRDGKVCHLQDSGEIIHGPGGQSVQMFGVVQDITEMRSAQAEQLRFQQIAAAQGRLAMLGELSAGVAHEFRNPLHGALNYTQLLRSNPSLDQTARQDLALIEEGLRRIDEIAGRMLRLARWDVQAREFLDLNGFIQEAVALVRVRAARSGIGLEVKSCPGLSPRQVNPGSLLEALLNLLTNALEVSPSGSTIRVQVAADSRDPSGVAIRVVDRGPGVPPNLRSRIFEPFFTTKPSGSGSGLGLCLAAQAAAEHRGSLEFEETPGGGATFVLRIPAPAS